MWSLVLLWGDRRRLGQEAAAPRILGMGTLSSGGLCFRVEAGPHSTTGTCRSLFLADTTWRSAPPPASWGPASQPGRGKCSSATWHLTTCGPCKVCVVFPVGLGGRRDGDRHHRSTRGGAQMPTNPSTQSQEDSGFPPFQEVVGSPFFRCLDFRSHWPSSSHMPVYQPVPGPGGGVL